MQSNAMQCYAMQYMGPCHAVENDFAFIFLLHVHLSDKYLLLFQKTLMVFGFIHRKKEKKKEEKTN